MGRLDNKVCIVTGSNSGVGAATAELFASEGAKVVITARRQELLDAEAEKIKAAGGTVLAVRCDVSKEEDCIELVRKTVEAFGTVDVLVNNAGVLEAGLKPVDSCLKEDVDRVAFQVVNSEIIKKDKFDALVLAGESDIVSRYSKNTVRGIVDQIALMELSSGECFIDKIHYLNPDTKQDDIEYRDGILSDLEERSVIKKNGKKCSINIKLYTLWIKTQL